MIEYHNDARDSAPQIDSAVLQHMLDETRDLFEEASNYALEGSRTTHAAMALTRADWLLMSVHNWVVGRLAGDAQENFETPVAVTGIDFRILSTALTRFVSRVDRLHARARNLDQLIETGEAADAIETREPVTAKVLHIFGDPASDDQHTNAVLESRQRINWAFGGV